MTGHAAPGRPRDPSIEGRVLEIALRHLAEHGYEGLSLAAVAEEAGTTRSALYRRWPGKAELATGAIASHSEADTRGITDDPYADLVAELAAFRRGVTRTDGLALVGTIPPNWPARAAAHEWRSLGGTAPEKRVWKREES